MTPSIPERVVVTGASRGLGLGFVRHWAEHGRTVFALARNAAACSALQELARTTGGRVHAVPCDVADPASVAAAASEVRAKSPAIDILVNNAGVFGTHGGTLETLDDAEVHRVLDINTLGPLRVARAFLPLLVAGTRPRIANITSLMGSIDDNGSGGSWAYRISKAALNMANRNLAHEVSPQGVTAVVVHPGWVQTDMGGVSAPLSIDTSVAGMIRVIEGLSPHDGGKFFDYEGDVIPW